MQMTVRIFFYDISFTQKNYQVQLRKTILLCTIPGNGDVRRISNCAGGIAEIITDEFTLCIECMIKKTAVVIPASHNMRPDIHWTVDFWEKTKILQQIKWPIVPLVVLGIKLLLSFLTIIILIGIACKRQQIPEAVVM
jgi:hypothetical protein